MSMPSHDPGAPAWRAYLRHSARLLARPIDLVRRYRREHIAADLIAGSTVGIVLLPQAIAFALLAGLPVEVGLFSAMVAPIAAALWGSSSHLSSGPTNTASILTLSLLAGIAMPGSPDYLAIAGLVALLSGLIRVLLGVFRLGVLVNFVSDSVAVGFTAGAGLLIAANQFDALLGVARPGDQSLVGIVAGIIPQLGAAHLPTLLTGLAAIAVIMTLQRIVPRAPVVLAGISLVAIGAALGGFEARGGAVLGAIPATFPPPLAWPAISLERVGALANGVLAIAVIGLVEAASIARSIASHSGQRIDSNQEFVGQGMANIVSGLCSGMPVSASFNRSALLFRAGGQTALANVIAALVVIFAVVVIGPLIAHLPRAALAGALILTAIGMIDARSMRRILRGTRGDAFIMGFTGITTLLLPLQFAVLFGVLMSLGHYIMRTSTPQVHVVLPDDQYLRWRHRPDRPECPQVVAVEILGDLYFGAVHHVEETIRQHLQRVPGRALVVLDLQSVQHCDMSGIHMLESLMRHCRAQGGDVYFTHVRDSIRHTMGQSGFDAAQQPRHFDDLGRAIDHLFYHRIDPAVCIYECEVRAFQECQNLPKRTFPIPRAIAGTMPELPQIAPRLLWAAVNHAPAPCVIDVREPREFARGHIPGALLMPLGAVLAGELAPPRDQPVVLVCRTGRRSQRAAITLHAQGYADLTILAGGMRAWHDEHLLEALDA